MKIPEIKISIPVGAPPVEGAPQGGAQSEGSIGTDQMNGEGVNSVYTSGSTSGNSVQEGFQEEPASQVPEELRALALNLEDPIDVEYKEPILRQIATKASLKSEWSSLLNEFEFGELGAPQGGR